MLVVANGRVPIDLYLYSTFFCQFISKSLNNVNRSQMKWLHSDKDEPEDTAARSWHYKPKNLHLAILFKLFWFYCLADKQKHHHIMLHCKVVHPKVKMISLFTHRHVIPKLYAKQKNILWFGNSPPLTSIIHFWVNYPLMFKIDYYNIIK